MYQTLCRVQKKSEIKIKVPFFGTWTILASLFHLKSLSINSPSCKELTADAAPLRKSLYAGQ